MAEIVLTVPNNQVTRVVDALCALGGYTGTPHETARSEFARGVAADLVRQAVLRVERNQLVVDAITTQTVTPVSVD